MCILYIINMLNKVKLLIGTFVIAMAFVATSALAAYDFGTVTIKVGSKGPAVVNVQTVVGATADGNFGPMTKAKVIAWQANNGLTPDGVFGPLSKAKANLIGGAVSGNFPAGCTSASGYSATTGTKCVSINANTFPVGCTSAAGFSQTTGVKCDSTTVTTPGVLVGGAGDAIMTHYATSEKSTIKEGEVGVKALGFRVEAIDSDISLQSVKVSIKNTDAPTSSYRTDAPTSSYRIDRYLDSVDVYMGSIKVGSANVSDFTKATDNTYSKSIAFSNAVVRNGDKNTFYVVLNVASTIDSDNNSASLNVSIDSYRFQDATGVIMTNSEDLSLVTNGDTIDNSSDALTLSSSSNSPVSSTVKVNESNTSDEVLALAFKLKAGTNSSDITLDSLPITVDIANSGADVSTDVINSVVVKIGSKIITADETTTTLASAKYTADFSGENVVISAGETTEAKVYITFQEQGGLTNANYANGATIVTASIVGTDVTSESVNDDTVITTGNKTGATLTLSTSAVILSNVSWSTTSGTGAGIIDLFFSLEAGNNDITLAIANLVTPTTTNVAIGVLSQISGDATTGDSLTWTIGSGSTGNFRVRYALTVSGGEVKVTTIAGQTVVTGKQLSPTVLYQ